MGLELELLCGQLPPVRTAASPATTTRTAADGAADDGCATPTSADNVLRAPSVCPPAPRKPRQAPAKRKHYSFVRRRRRCRGPAVLPSALPRWIVAVPHDVLAAVFVARRPASTGGSPCRPPAGKKIRVHVVG